MTATIPTTMPGPTSPAPSTPLTGGAIGEAANVIRITGGNRLTGSVVISGSKNAALPALAATLLTEDECVLRNVPDLADIQTMVALLRSLGAQVEVDRAKRRIMVRAARLTSTAAPPDLVGKMRASFLVAGPLLARFGEVTATTPGGCHLGARPVDVDVRGFRRMGAEVDFSEQTVSARTVGLRGAFIYMDYPSHTGTENLLMAASLASGRTTIVNASCEPEIIALGNMLVRMGARISGLGSPTLVVDGVDRLHGVSEVILPDRLQAGTFAIAAVLTKGEVKLHGVRPADMLPLTAKLTEAGAEVWEHEDTMMVRGGATLRAVEVQTLPFPGFPTDLQASFGTLLTQAEGRSKIHERVFEDRLRYTDQLNAMGADVRVERYHVHGSDQPRYGTLAEFHGPTPLRGAAVRALDIRAGAGVVLAGLAAKGETTVSDIYHLARGYEDFVPTLRSLGATISEGTADAAP